MVKGGLTNSTTHWSFFLFLRDELRKDLAIDYPYLFNNDLYECKDFIKQRDGLHIGPFHFISSHNSTSYHILYHIHRPKHLCISDYDCRVYESFRAEFSAGHCLSSLTYIYTSNTFLKGISCIVFVRNIITGWGTGTAFVCFSNEMIWVYHCITKFCDFL